MFSSEERIIFWCLNPGSGGMVQDIQPTGAFAPSVSPPAVRYRQTGSFSWAFWVKDSNKFLLCGYESPDTTKGCRESRKLSSD